MATAIKSTNAYSVKADDRDSQRKTTGYKSHQGTEPASRYGIRSEWEVPEDAFMILLLDAPEMNRISGVAKYRQEFTEIM